MAQPIPPLPPLAPPPPTWWQQHGTTATWVAIAAALVVGFANTGSTWYFRHADSTAKSSDEHIKSLVDERLGPATEKTHVDLKEQLAPVGTQLKELNDKMSSLSERITKLEGRFEQLSDDQKRTQRLQLDKLSQQIVAARQSGKKIDSQTVSALGKDLLDVASTGSENSPVAWKVLNETLAYYSTTTDISKLEKQSFAIRLDNKDSECLRIAPRANHWLFLGMLFEHCTQHLDSIVGPTAVANSVFIENTIFRDVRVIYSGGPLRLRNIYFVNCTFELQQNEPSTIFVKTLLADGHIPQLVWPVRSDSNAN